MADIAKPAEVESRIILRSLRNYQSFGAFCIVALLGGLGGWAAVIEISGAVLAPGSVVVEGNSKKVQHLEGGIVAALSVRNADSVKAGQLLVRLDDTEPRATLLILRKQIDELRARQARLNAERYGATEFQLPAAVASGTPEISRAAAWSDQVKLFEVRRGARADKEQQLLERIIQLQEVGRGVEAQLQAKSTQISLLAGEIEGLVQLFEQQLVPKPRLLALQREHSKLDGERGQLLAEAARLQVQVGETRLQLSEAKQTFLSEVLTELREVENRLAELVERETAAEAKLKRLSVIAPIDGVVHRLNIYTVGGVVAPGETLMEILPSEAYLVVEGQLEPNSIDQVKKDQPVLLRFTAFDHNQTPELKGRVVSISADVRQDAPQSPRYYAVRATLEAGEAEKLGPGRIVPGMPAELMIRRGDRTVLAYLTKPLFDRLAHTFRER